MARRAAKPKEQKPIEQSVWDAANKLRGIPFPYSAVRSREARMVKRYRPAGLPR